ncbi:MAG TPA: SDR family oxidoreductase [Aestuariivirga sp.]|nr:SDR family oxidoreductase [Aestuariivirga sp.]
MTGIDDDIIVVAVWRISNMKLVVFGASGGTGREIIGQALDQGHEVTAFVRDPKKLAITHGKLHIVEGDALKDQSVIAGAIAGRDAIICALGVGNSLKSAGLIAESLAAIVPAAEKHDVRRLILISAFGVGDSFRHAPLVPRLMYRLLLGDVYRDKKAGEDMVKASGLDWTVIHPVMLTNGPKTGTYRSGERLDLRGIPKVSRADVAHCALSQLTDESFLHKIAVIST